MWGRREGLPLKRSARDGWGQSAAMTILKMAVLEGAMPVHRPLKGSEKNDATTRGSSGMSKHHD